MTHAQKTAADLKKGDIFIFKGEEKSEAKIFTGHYPLPCDGVDGYEYDSKEKPFNRIEVAFGTSVFVEKI